LVEDGVELPLVLPVPVEVLEPFDVVLDAPVLLSAPDPFTSAPLLALA